MEGDRLGDDDEIFQFRYGVAKWTRCMIGPRLDDLDPVSINGLILINQPPAFVSLSPNPDFQGSL